MTMDAIDADPIRSDARKARRARVFERDAACALCGLTDPTSLVAAKRTLLEAHHVAGRAHAADLTVPLCRHCHAIATAAQRDAGADLTPPPTVLHQIGQALASLGALFVLLGTRMVEWSRCLLGLPEELDGFAPGWRNLPAARPFGAAS